MQAEDLATNENQPLDTANRKNISQSSLNRLGSVGQDEGTEEVHNMQQVGNYGQLPDHGSAYAFLPSVDSAQEAR